MAKAPWLHDVLLDRGGGIRCFESACGYGLRIARGEYMPIDEYHDRGGEGVLGGECDLAVCSIRGSSNYMLIDQV